MVDLVVPGQFGSLLLVGILVVDGQVQLATLVVLLEEHSLLRFGVG